MLFHRAAIQFGAGEYGADDDLPEEVCDRSQDGPAQLGDLDGVLASQLAVEEVDGVVLFQQHQLIKHLAAHVLGLLLAALLHHHVKKIDLLLGLQEFGHYRQAFGAGGEEGVALIDHVRLDVLFGVPEPGGLLLGSLLFGLAASILHFDVFWSFREEIGFTLAGRGAGLEVSQFGICVGRVCVGGGLREGSEGSEAGHVGVGQKQEEVCLHVI